MKLNNGYGEWPRYGTNCDQTKKKIEETSQAVKTAEVRSQTIHVWNIYLHLTHK